MESAVVLALHQLAISHAWLATFIVDLAQYGIFLLPLAVVVLWFRADLRTDRRRGAILVGVVAAGVAFVLGLTLEQTLNRPRPFVELGFEPFLAHAADSSFPSDHTLVGAALVGPILWRARKLGSLLLIWALVVGAARVAAGLHYPSDIVGSAILALGLDTVIWLVMRSALAQLSLDTWVPHRIRNSS